MTRPRTIDAATATKKSPQPAHGVTPLKPRPVLFAMLCLVFATWVAFLAGLYFETVYPHRHPATTQAATSAPLD
jgi:hypothetical protein